jgi:hypothetical protein
MKINYWSYTIQNVPRDPLPALMSNESLCDKFLVWKIEQGREYEAYCMEVNEKFPTPEAVTHHATWLFANMPAEVVVDKRPISKEEFDAWEAETEHCVEEDYCARHGWDEYNI